MPRMTMTEMRNNFAKTVDRVAYEGDRIEVVCRRNVAAGIVSMDDLELIRQIKELILGKKGRKGMAKR